VMPWDVTEALHQRHYAIDILVQQAGHRLVKQHQPRRRRKTDRNPQQKLWPCDRLPATSSSSADPP